MAGAGGNSDSRGGAPAGRGANSRPGDQGAVAQHSAAQRSAAAASTQGIFTTASPANAMQPPATSTDGQRRGLAASKQACAHPTDRCAGGGPSAPRRRTGHAPQGAAGQSWGPSGRPDSRLQVDSTPTGRGAPRASQPWDAP